MNLLSVKRPEVIQLANFMKLSKICMWIESFPTASIADTALYKHITKIYICLGICKSKYVNQMIIEKATSSLLARQQNYNSRTKAATVVLYTIY